ncbi:MAG: hypothetical protein K5770_05190 [Lachnospiraceae bacterium]|nr:hypothetical protein [Lachnospiraceae bacterium]
MERERKDLLKGAKKTGQKAKAIKKVTDDQLEEVTGGYWEKTGWAAGFWIECPKCHNYLRSNFFTYVADGKDRLDGYECQNPACGYVFGVDANGDYWLS